jgi:hypothetical protein
VSVKRIFGEDREVRCFRCGRVILVGPYVGFQTALCVFCDHGTERLGELVAQEEILTHRSVGTTIEDLSREAPRKKQIKKKPATEEEPQPQKPQYQELDLFGPGVHNNPDIGVIEPTWKRRRT